MLGLRLHMLCELEHAFTELQKESTEKKAWAQTQLDARQLMTQKLVQSQGTHPGPAESSSQS